jgi:hypothetical protein
MTDPSLLKRLGEVGTLKSLGVVAFPNVSIPLRVDTRSSLRSSSRTSENHGLSRQFACTTAALSGFLALRKSSMASLLRRRFQFAHSCDPLVRIVGQ